MKKLLALMFVCVGLTAMAITPHVDGNQMLQHQTIKGQKMLKSNKLMNQLNIPTMTVQQFGRQMKAEGKSLTKAPRRITSKDDLIGTYIFFGDQYSWSQNSSTYAVTLDTIPYSVGGWDVTLIANDGDDLLTFGNMLGLNEYDVDLEPEITIDASAQTFSIAGGTATTGHQGTGTVRQTTSQGKKVYQRVDTIEINYLCALTDGESLSFSSPLTGTIDENNWLSFDNVMAVYTEVGYYTYQGSAQSNLALKDSTFSAYLAVYKDAVLVPPTGKHEYKYGDTGGEDTDTYTDNVLMYQYNDTVAMVWNLWGQGGYSNFFFIYPDGSMTFPSWQNVYDLSYNAWYYYSTRYTSYDWTGAQDFYNLSGTYDFAADTLMTITGADVTGAVTPTQMTWDLSCAGNFLDQGTDNEGLGFLDTYINNRVYFTNGDEFLLTKADAPVFADPVVGEEFVTISATSEQEGATVYLFLLTVDEEGNITDATAVTNPYEAERTTEDQVIYMAARAQVEGMGLSDYVYQTFEIPAYVEPYTGTLYVLGEVDGKSWAPNDGAPMTYSEENANFTVTVNATGVTETDGVAYSYFSFSKVLAENNDQGGWDYIAPYRYGAVADAGTDFWVLDEHYGQPLSLTAGETAFRVPSGYMYELIVNTYLNTLIINNQGAIPTEEWQPGDVNHDGKVDVADVSMTINRVLGKENTNAFYEAQGDINGDGKIDVSDVSNIINIVLGK